MVWRSDDTVIFMATVWLAVLAGPNWFDFATLLPRFRVLLLLLLLIPYYLLIYYVLAYLHQEAEHKTILAILLRITSSYIHYNLNPRIRITNQSLVASSTQSTLRSASSQTNETRSPASMRAM